MKGSRGGILTEIQLLAGAPQVHPFGRGLDEEMPDEVAAVVTFGWHGGAVSAVRLGSVTPPCPPPGPHLEHQEPSWPARRSRGTTCCPAPGTRPAPGPAAAGWLWGTVGLSPVQGVPHPRHRAAPRRPSSPRSLLMVGLNQNLEVSITNFKVGCSARRGPAGG